MAIEDANTTKTNIHVMYLDLVNAFGYIDLRQMCATMLRLGNPEHIIETICNLYTSTSIVVDTPLGKTSPILNTGRGTFQGDPLSPTLFTIRVEPLIRWLAARDRSYECGTNNLKSEATGVLLQRTDTSEYARTPWVPSSENYSVPPLGGIGSEPGPRAEEHNSD